MHALRTLRWEFKCCFIQNGCFELPTFTKTLCDSFARSPLHFLHHGNVMEIAITEHDKTYAIKVMKARLLCRRVFFLI